MPTLKQKKAFEAVGVNGGNVSQAMKTAGYSEEVSKRTDKLTKTKGWQELMEEFLPDDLLAKVHQDGLNATRVISAVITDKEANGGTSDFVEVPDYAVREKYLVDAYKLKGSFAPERSVNLDVKTTAKEIREASGQVQMLKEKFEEELKKALAT